MMDKLAEQIVDTDVSFLSSGRPHRMVSAAAGIAHSMALASDGSLFTWGDGRYGQIGQPMPEDIANMIPDPPVLLMCSPLPKRLVKLEPGSLKASDRCVKPRPPTFRAVLQAWIAWQPFIVVLLMLWPNNVTDSVLNSVSSLCTFA